MDAAHPPREFAEPSSKCSNELLTLQMATLARLEWRSGAGSFQPLADDIRSADEA